MRIMCFFNSIKGKMLVITLVCALLSALSFYGCSADKDYTSVQEFLDIADRMDSYVKNDLSIPDNYDFEESIDLRMIQGDNTISLGEENEHFVVNVWAPLKNKNKVIDYIVGIPGQIGLKKFDKRFIKSKVDTFLKDKKSWFSFLYKNAEFDLNGDENEINIKVSFDKKDLIPYEKLCNYSIDAFSEKPSFEFDYSALLSQPQNNETIMISIYSIGEYENDKSLQKEGTFYRLDYDYDRSDITDETQFPNLCFNIIEHLDKDFSREEFNDFLSEPLTNDGEFLSAEKLFDFWGRCGFIRIVNRDLINNCYHESIVIGGEYLG